MILAPDGVVAVHSVEDDQAPPQLRGQAQQVGLVRLTSRSITALVASLVVTGPRLRMIMERL